MLLVRLALYSPPSACISRIIVLRSPASMPVTHTTHSTDSSRCDCLRLWECAEWRSCSSAAGRLGWTATQVSAILVKGGVLV